MKKIADKICKHKISILIISIVLFVLSFIGIHFTKINYDILVYLPKDIETIRGQNILTDDFEMGAYSVVVAENLSSKEILQLEEDFKKVKGVNKVLSIYDVIGTTIPIEMLPSEITSKLNQENSDLMFITFEESTSSESTINAVKEIKDISENKVKVGGMSAMVLDTMNLSEQEIAIYILIAVTLCLIVLELSLDSYIAPLLLLGNIGISIIFNLGSNVIFGEISYVTKALVAVLQLGVTTDFSIFLYHAYENKKKEGLEKEAAMSSAIVETFSSVTGSSLTTIAGFLVLCAMQLTLGQDLGLVMAKGVFLGVVSVLTLFPSMLLIFDNTLAKTKHKPITFHFEKLNERVIKHYKVIFAIFLLLLIPAYLANSKVDVYYKIDKSLPETLDSIVANNELKEKFNIVSPEIILVDKNMSDFRQQEMLKQIEKVEGVDFAISFVKLKEMGLNEQLLPSDMQDILNSKDYQLILLNSTYDIATDELNDQIVEINRIIDQYDKKGILAGEGPLMKDLVTISDKDFKNVNYASVICILLIMVLVLNSVSLPVLLTLAIEFAIFLNMSFSYFNGAVLPFVAPIVLGTIQLGATIDYAILMTTKYLNLRKRNIEKKEAMLQTTNQCVNSILVSGMCFFAATCGVGLYSKLEMVASLCTLISRGAIISMLVVIVILPSILLLFDNLILKTTLGMKGKKKMTKKNKFKKVVAISLILSLAINPLSAMALSKEETVYSKLAADGSVKKTIVNEHLINNEKIDKLEDISDLKDILNINSDHTFTQDKNLITWDSKGNDIFYQGISNKSMPITEQITYQLEGKQITLDELLGKSGHVTIKIKYQNIDKHLVNISGVKESLYTPFVVTTATTIDSKNNSNISVANGKVVDNGKQYMVVGLSVPGLYESLNMQELKGLDTVTISFDTKKFELASIYSVITPKLIDSSDLEVFNKLDSTYKDVDTLQSSIDKIATGSASLLQGISTVSSGSEQITTNLNIVSQKIEEINTGVISVDTGLKQILANLNAVKEEFNSQENQTKLAKLQFLINTNKATISTLTEQNNNLKVAYETYSLSELTYIDLLNAGNEELFNIKYQYENNYANNMKLIQGYFLTNNALEETTKTILTNSVMIDELIGYVTEIQQGTNQLATGTTQLKQGVTLLASKMTELSTGTNTLKEGMTTLNTGITTFNKEGINKLTGKSYEIKRLSNKTKTLVKLGDDYQSFTEKSNATSANTKFVFIVDGVKAPEKTKEVKNTTEKTTFTERVKNLFK